MNHDRLDSDGTFTEDDQGNWHEVTPPAAVCPPCRMGDHAGHQLEVMDHEPCQCPQHANDAAQFLGTDAAGWDHWRIPATGKRTMTVHKTGEDQEL